MWGHNWIPCSEGLRKPLSNITNQNITVKDLWSIDKRWDEHVIKGNFNNPTELRDICKIYIPVGSENDKRVWPFTKNGQLTRKSAYRELVKKRNNTQDPIINWKDFWRILFLEESFSLVRSA